jgi:deazaflavin-dependent oxidoreductase (nitroreductase family)
VAAEKKNRMVRQPKGRIRFFSALNRGFYRLTRGKILNTFRGAPVVLLTTKGRKTGKARTWPLLTVKEGESYAFAGSFGGHDQHPGWYHNLVADPNVTVHDEGREVRGRARVVTGPERDRLYRQFVDVYSTYAAYAQATDREIPVVVVDPV